MSKTNQTNKGKKSKFFRRKGWFIGRNGVCCDSVHKYDEYLTTIWVLSVKKIIATDIGIEPMTYRLTADSADREKSKTSV